MARRKKRRQRAKRGQRSQHRVGVSPQAVQIVQRRFGGRPPDRPTVFRALVREAHRMLDKSRYQDALELTEQAAQLARSRDERQACDALLAEIYFQQASTRTGRARLEDLEKAAELAPQKPLYRVHLARALEQDGRIDKALTHYRAVSKVWKDSGVGYLWCVAALEAGRPQPRVDLSPAERNTLTIVQRLASKDPKAVRLAEPVLDGSLPLWKALAQMLADDQTAPVEELKTVTSMLDGTEATGIVHYYLGVAALRAGDLDAAWLALDDAREAGYTSPWMKENLSYLARVQAIRQAEAGNWQAVVRVGEPVLDETDDRILAETVGLARYHLGYKAALTGKWAAAIRHWQQAERYASSCYLAQNLALALEQREDWQGAAEAWRDLIRRRPRRKDHPDHLSDNQVAGLWRHAAECYKRAGNPAEAITCLRNGLKYAPDDVEMRSELSSALMANEQIEAAENELGRILERDPDNVEALVRLGQLYKADRWWGGSYKAIEVLKRALELDPNHEEARDALGGYYIEQGRRYGQWGMYDLAVEQYRAGLEYLPDYPPLHIDLGEAERCRGDDAAAREHLLQAYELEPDRTRTVGPVLHELLHLDAEEDVERLLPRIRQMPGLLPGFWTNQGKQVLECALDRAWAQRFFEEALGLVGQAWVSKTRAEVLVNIVMTLFHLGEVKGDLGWRYRKRIDSEVPQSGAKEFINGLIAALEEHDWKKAERLLSRARRKARKAGEEGLLERIGMAEELIYAGPGSFYDILERVFG